MKKRIISLILVLVIAALSLISCGYSIKDEDLTAYATFADKAAFEAAWKTLSIVDGDFTVDKTVRDNKVLDSIYADLAASVKDNAEEKKEGVMAGHDVLYYNYYCTAEFDGKTVVLFASSMKAGSTSSVQLGESDHDELEKKIAALVAGVDLKDKTYTTETSGYVAEGDVVYISYSYTHQVEVKDETTGETATKSETVNVTNERLVLTPGNPFVDYLLKKDDKGNTAEINKTTIQDIEIEGKSYKGIKINWREKGAELGTVVNKTFTESKKVNDTNGVSRELKDVELTYHIYPAHFITVPEFNATNLINIILGKQITIDYVSSIIFGKDFNDKTDEEKKLLLDQFITKDGDKDVSLEDFVKALATLQTELEDAKKSLENAKTDAATKEATRDAAKADYDKDPTDAKKDSLEKAETALTAANELVKSSETKHAEKLAARDAKVTAFLAIKTDMEKTMTDGYTTATYEYLLEEYNEEIRMNLAKEIYALMEKNVSVTGTPEKAVDATYKQLIENYEYEFYNGDYDTSKKITNYKQYNGSFKSYLVDAVKKDIKTVSNYDEALAAIREKAVEYVKPVVMIYVLSEAYGVVATDDEWKEYKENPDNGYDADEYNYGETSVLYAYQFDKLMNHILEYTENEETGAYDYKNVVYTTDKTAEDAE